MTTALSSDTLTKITPALIEAQKAFKPAIKDSTNPAFKSKYVSLDAVLEAVTEALLNNGISPLQPTYRAEDGTTILVTRLVHISGEWIAGEYPIVPVKKDPQGEGSAMTYGRRYALMSLLGIAPEDDDGNAASKASTASRPKAEPKFDEDQHNSLLSAVLDAPSIDALNKAGQQVAKAEMPSQARDELRKAFSERMAALRKANA